MNWAKKSFFKDKMHHGVHFIFGVQTCFPFYLTSSFHICTSFLSCWKPQFPHNQHNFPPTMHTQNCEASAPYSSVITGNSLRWFSFSFSCFRILLGLGYQVTVFLIFSLLSSCVIMLLSDRGLYSFISSAFLSFETWLIKCQYFFFNCAKYLQSSKVKPKRKYILGRLWLVSLASVSCSLPFS